jgi:hypothetical protein
VSKHFLPTVAIPASDRRRLASTGSVIFAIHQLPGLPRASSIQNVTHDPMPLLFRIPVRDEDPFDDDPGPRAVKYKERV